jgi:hypothetical protein
LMPYFPGLFDIYTLNAHLPRNVTNSSSMVPYGNAVYIILQLPAETSLTSRSGAKCHGTDSYQQDGGGGRPVIGTGLWNEISKGLVTTRLTKYSKTAFTI